MNFTGFTSKSLIGTFIFRVIKGLKIVFLLQKNRIFVLSINTITVNTFISEKPFMHKGIKHNQAVIQLKYLKINLKESKNVHRPM